MEQTMVEGIEVQLTTGQKKLGVGVCWITLVGWIGTMVLWGVGLIGDDASGFWWLLPALLGIPLAVLIQIAARMVSEEEALPGAPFMTHIATLAVVIQNDQPVKRWWLGYRRWLGAKHCYRYMGSRNAVLQLEKLAPHLG